MLCKKILIIEWKYSRERSIEILNDIFELHTLSQVSQKEIVEVCISAGIFAEEMTCLCTNSINLIANASKKDQYVWKCNFCKVKRSIRANSVVEDCRLELAFSQSIIRCFVTRISPQKVVELYSLKFDRRAVYRLYANLHKYLLHACQL